MRVYARYFKKIFVVVSVLFLISLGVFLLRISERYVVPVMMYHQVTYSQKPQPNWVSPENFEWQMDYLKTHGYNVIPLDELVDGINKGRNFPHKTVAITFDDGYENNYTEAFRILKKYNFPATVFVAAGKVDQEKRLTWEQMKEMMAAGIEIGSHTISEAYLPDLTTSQQKKEIEESKRILEKNLGVKIEHFAYPIGGFSEEIKAIVKNAGYQSACATNRGYDRLNKDVYELNRIRFSDKDNRKDYLWMKLSGYYNLFREAKKPY